MQYLKTLDGIRAIAVGLVLLFHFGYFPVGWVGVQIFFVLSGYLITSILLQTKNKSFTAYVGTFYWNRALRIFPLLYAFLAAAAVAYLIFGVPKSFRTDWIWLATFSANFARLRPEDVGPSFVHIWSLAVEQQFYIVWPVLVFLLPPKILKFTVGTILAITPLLRLAIFEVSIHWGFDVEFAGKAAYVLPVAQFDAFAAGAALPLWGLDRLAHAGRRVIFVGVLTAALGFAVLASAYFGGRGAFIASFGYAMFLLPSYGFVWGYSLLNILFLLIIICAVQGMWGARFLQAKVLVFLGRISYGIYVYHLPLLLLGVGVVDTIGVDVHKGPQRLAFFVVWVIITIFVSHQSFRWLESPFLRLKMRGATSARTATTLASRNR